MDEREKVYDLVYDLISEYVIQYREWMNKGVELPRLDREEVVDQIDALYDALYSDREKAMREALEVAYDLLTSVTGHKVSIGSIDKCYQANLYVTSVDEAIRKIKQAKEEK